MSKKCPVCGDIAVLREKRLNLYKCKRCAHPFTVLPEERQEQYNHDYFTQEHKNWFSNPDTTLFDFIYYRLLKLLGNKSINLLDVGCGNGTFLRYILSKKSTLKLTGIDLADNRDDKIHFIKGDFLKEELNEKFDVICSIVTIEHINSPHLFIQRIKNTLKPNGLVFIMTVNSNGLIYILGELLNKLGITVVKDRLYSSHHLNHYSDRSLRRLMEMENFDILLHKKHNYSIRSVDVPKSNIAMENMYRLSVLLIFLTSSIFRCEYLQTIVCRKRG